MWVRGYLWLLLMLGIIQHGHRESAVSAVGAEEEAAEADPTPDSSLTNTEDRGHRERRDTDTSCHTVSGPDTGSPCIFPFIWKEKTHMSCVTDKKKGKKWCSTRVDSSGFHVKGNYGYCNDDCTPTVTRPDLCTQD